MSNGALRLRESLDARGQNRSLTKERSILSGAGIRDRSRDYTMRELDKMTTGNQGE